MFGRGRPLYFAELLKYEDAREADTVVVGGPRMTVLGARIVEGIT